MCDISGINVPWSLLGCIVWGCRKQDMKTLLSYTPMNAHDTGSNWTSYSPWWHMGVQQIKMEANGEKSLPCVLPCLVFQGCCLKSLIQIACWGSMSLRCDETELETLCSVLGTQYWMVTHSVRGIWRDFSYPLECSLVIVFWDSLALSGINIIHKEARGRLTICCQTWWQHLQRNRKYPQDFH